MRNAQHKLCLVGKLIEFHQMWTAQRASAALFKHATSHRPRQQAVNFATKSRIPTSAGSLQRRLGRQFKQPTSVSLVSLVSLALAGGGEAFAIGPNYSPNSISRARTKLSYASRSAAAGGWL